jgi:hypothetical protein
MTRTTRPLRTAQRPVEPGGDLRRVLELQAAGQRSVRDGDHRETGRDVVADEDVHLHAGRIAAADPGIRPPPTIGG